MLELMLCSLLTIFPDYLYRRYVQGKRFGKEITFYSVWYELRWGIPACLILTVCLITTIFYNHPSTTNVTLFFRTVPILPEINGRVAEIYVGFSGRVEKGAMIFKLDSSKQEAAAETARRKVAEVEAAMVIAKSDILKAEAQIEEAKSNHQQTLDELEAKEELQRRNPGNVPFREIERLQVRAQGQLAAISAAEATKKGLDQRLSTLLPAEKSSAEAELAQAQAESGQDRDSRGRQRAGRAVRAAGRRYRQSAHAAGRRSDPGGCRATKPPGGLRSDRSADHEGRNDSRGYLRL